MRQTPKATGVAFSIELSRLESSTHTHIYKCMPLYIIQRMRYGSSEKVLGYIYPYFAFT